MKVRIVAAISSSWYVHKIGHVVEVEDELIHGLYKVKGCNRWIRPENVERVLSS